MVDEEGVRDAAIVLYKHAVTCDDRARVENGAMKTAMERTAEHYWEAVAAMNWMLGDDENLVARTVLEGADQMVVVVGGGKCAGDNPQPPPDFAADQPIPYELVVHSPLEGK